jgi:transcriptional regulator with XRE-family HTH domain
MSTFSNMVTATQLPGLKYTRERRLITQVGLAQLSDVAETTINRLENAHHQARFSTAQKLADALGVAPGILQEDPRVLLAHDTLGSDASMVLKWLIQICRGMAIGQRMSRAEYLKTWGDYLPKRVERVIDALIAAGFVIQSEDRYALTPAPLTPELAARHSGAIPSVLIPRTVPRPRPDANWLPPIPPVR